MPEVVARGRLDTEPAAAEVDLIEVGLEDLLLGVVPLHLTSGLLLVKLSAHA